MPKDVKLKRFDPDKQLYAHASMLFAGAKKTGKSFTARCISYYLRSKVYGALVFTGSQEIDHPWTDYVPRAFVHSGFNGAALSMAFEMQEEMKEMMGGKKTPPEFMLVFEDLEYTKHNIFTDESCKRMLLNGRHSGFTPMVLVQYIMKGLTKEVRGMFDFVFLQKETDIDTRKKLHQVFGGVVDFQTFETIFRTCTEDHGTLVIYLRANSYDPTDTFFWFKARDMGEFRIGHRDFWKFDELNRRPKRRIAGARADDAADDEVMQTALDHNQTLRAIGKAMPLPSLDDDDGEDNVVAKTPLPDSGRLMLLE
jgi:hypothetical protein